MSRALLMSLAGLLVLPAAAAADPIPVTGIVGQTDNYGASVRLDRGASPGAPAFGASRSPRVASAGEPVRQGEPISQSVTPADAVVTAAVSLAAGAYTAAPGLDRENASSSPAGVPLPLQASAPLPIGAAVSPGAGQALAPVVTQAFRDAFGTLTATEIADNELAPVVGAMEATDVMLLGGGQSAAAFTSSDLTLAPPVVPASEPATLVLIGSGLLALARRQRSRRLSRDITGQ